MYKDNTVGNVVAETGRDGGTTTRLSHLSMPFPLCASPLKDEVQRSPEPSARPSAAVDSEERQICTTCRNFSRRVLDCAYICFLPSCTMYKDNAVGNVVAEMGRDLVFMTTARLSDLSMPLKGEVWRSTWTVCTAADCEERQSCTTCLFAESIGSVWKVDGLVCFLQHTSVWEGIGGSGEEGRFNLTWQPAVKHQNHLPKPQQKNSNSCDRSGPSKGAQTRTTRVKVQQYKYWEKFKAGPPPWFEFLVIFDFFAPWYRRRWEASSVNIS